jgi:hypothetical protein
LSTQRHQCQHLGPQATSEHSEDAKKKCNESYQATARIRKETSMKVVPMRPVMPRDVNTEAPKSETVGIRRCHPGWGIVKMYFKKPDYSKIKPKVDTRRKRAPLAL